MGFYNIVAVETAILAGLSLIAALVLRGKVSWAWLVGAIAVYAASGVITFFGASDAVPDLIAGRYNAEGKLASFIFLLGAGLLIFRGDAKAIGLTLSQSGPAPIPGITVAAGTALATVALMYLYFPGVKTEPVADMVYQMTLPSLDEELLYRGVMLVMLERAFAPALSKLWNRAGLAALITTAMFYLTHAMTVSPDGSIMIVWGEILPLITAMLWVYVRIATGSLLLPILLHSLFNGVGYVL